MQMNKNILALMPVFVLMIVYQKGFVNGGAEGKEHE